MTRSSRPAAADVLHEVFGFRAFRPLQGEVVEHVSAGGDALVLMPTGGGKSLCYQVPALTRSGTAVVVSPLIALMHDQVRGLVQAGVRAACLNSSLDAEEVRRVEQDLLAGRLDLLYCAPERLLGGRMLDLLGRIDLALFAIDEAHCVSQWGHDFRPEYLQLSVIQERFPRVPRLALTATADERTKGEIARRLGLETARHFIGSFDRPNIRYIVAPKNNARQQLEQFLRREHPEDAGIVYCLSRRRVDETADWLQRQGRDALPYHAGLAQAERQRNQQRFVNDDGVIIVATIAFGMGIDKPDVRFVAHLDLPRSLEAYYQETGRAGRDGLPANAWMVYGHQDVAMLRQLLAESSAPDERKRVERQKLESMLAFCEGTGCRRQQLLAYFDERLDQPCGNCDTCLWPPRTWDATEAARMALSCVYRTGQRFGVAHLVDVLTGKDGDRVRQLAHDRLSTWGIGKAHSAREWRSVFRQLLAFGYLTVDADGYGSLCLTERCRPLLRGEASVTLRQDPEKRSRRSADLGRRFVDAATRELWDALRARRRRLAEEQGVPPYLIFHDATLQAMVEQRPQTMAEFAALPGVGETKRQRYGEAFLQVLSGDGALPAESATGGGVASSGSGS